MNLTEDELPMASQPSGPEPSPEQPMRKGHRITLILAGFVVLTGVVILLYFVFLANTSSKGSVSITKPSASDGRPKENLSLKGKYVRFNYAPSYVSENTQVTVPNALEQHVLLSNGFEGKQIAVVVNKFIEGSLDENASYKFRSVHPEDYTEKPLRVIGSTGAIMEKHDGSEVTAFVTRGGLIVSISLTANNASSAHAELSTEMNALLKSFSWVQ